MSQTELLIDVAGALDRVGVGYLLTGSFASSLQGEPRATHDIDFVIQVDMRAIEALVGAFGEPRYFFDPNGARAALSEHSMFNLLDTSTGDKVDFWPLSEDSFDISRFGRRRSVEVFGTTICVSAPEDTIVQKLKWAVASGGSTRHLNDALGVYELQRGTLDEEYLEEWAERLGLVAELADIRERASQAGEQV